MVNAILAGQKTMTRRVLKTVPGVGGLPLVRLPGQGSAIYIDFDGLAGLAWRPCGGSPTEPWPTERMGDVCPYGGVGDRLIVKESAWMWCEKRPNGTGKSGRPKFLYVPMREAFVFYCADHPDKPFMGVVSPETGNQWGWRKKLGRFLPRWASRITLEITEVRAERLHEISAYDVVAEGIDLAEHKCGCEACCRTSALCTATQSSLMLEWIRLWDSINAERGFPWESDPWVWKIGFKRAGQEARTA
jgi:hypothetical protein